MNNHFLIIVDMQNDFITGSLGSEDAQSIVPNVVKKILTHYGPVIATMDTHDEYYNDTLEGKMLPIEHCIENSDGWEMEKQVAKAILTQGNYVGFVKKPTFGSTSLPEVIKQYVENVASVGRNIEELKVPNNKEPEFTIIGLDTDICVISNALLLRAAFPNSKITIDSKCCAGTSKHAHKSALEVAKSCQITVV